MECYIEHDENGEHSAVTPDDHWHSARPGCENKKALENGASIMSGCGRMCSMDKILQDSLYNL
jgi:hypothetical protein